MLSQDKYIEKYLKYKLKYLKLKEQIGGTGHYYLPCEIEHPTKMLLKNSNVFNTKEYVDTLSKIINIVNIESIEEFFQDHSIILKNMINDKLLLLQIKQNSYIERLQENTDIIIDKSLMDLVSNTFAYGGNFISSPIFEGRYVIFCCKNKYIQSKIDTVKDKLIEHITEKQTLIELDCSFCASNGRHIDELMCFMPYEEYRIFDKLLKFKIWIYKIRDIYISDIVEMTDNYNILKKKLQIINDKTEFFKEVLNEIDISIKYEKKVREHERDDDIIIDNFFKGFALTNITNDIIKVCTRIYNVSEEVLKNDKRLIRKLKFINADNYKKLKLIIYIYILKFFGGIDYIDNKQILIDYYNTEQDRNKDIIISSIFNLDISSNIAIINEIKKILFVEYPIDLIIQDININPECKFNFSPIFNRCWIETDENVLCIFPNGSIKEADSIEQDILMDPKEYQIDKHISNDSNDSEINDILAIQKPLIKSMLNPAKEIVYKFFNTSKYHGTSTGNTGGNIHCLLKQIF
jgi:hypothetical protein